MIEFKTGKKHSLMLLFLLNSLKTEELLLYTLLLLLLFYSFILEWKEGEFWLFRKLKLCRWYGVTNCASLSGSWIKAMMLLMSVSVQMAGAVSDKIVIPSNIYLKRIDKLDAYEDFATNSIWLGYQSTGDKIGQNIRYMHTQLYFTIHTQWINDPWQQQTGIISAISLFLRRFL